MPIPEFGGAYLDDKSTPEEIIDHVSLLQKTVEYHLSGQLDSTNAREFGGWRIAQDTLSSKSGNVGLFSGDTVDDDVRFWAGSAIREEAPFRVYESGRTVVTNIDIVGGNILWGNTNVPEIPYSDITGSKPPTDANNTYSELLYNSGIRGFVYAGGNLYLTADHVIAGSLIGRTVKTAVSGTRVELHSDYADAYFYTGTSTNKWQIFDGLNGFIVGSTNVDTFCEGNWNFLGTVTGVEATAKFG